MKSGNIKKLKNNRCLYQLYSNQLSNLRAVSLAPEAEKLKNRQKMFKKLKKLQILSTKFAKIRDIEIMKTTPLQLKTKH